MKPPAYIPPEVLSGGLERCVRRVEVRTAPGSVASVHCRHQGNWRAYREMRYAMRARSDSILTRSWTTVRLGTRNLLHDQDLGCLA